MSTVLNPAIVPEQVFYSVFRNTSNGPLYVWWVGGHGMTIEAGEHFNFAGDPRSWQQLPRSRSLIESMRSMIEEGVLEFVSSPAVIVDNQMPDGLSVAMLSKDGTMAPENVPIQRADAEARVLPTVVATATYNATDNEILVDWSAFAGLELTDRFNLLVTLPSGETTVVRCGPDKSVSYVPAEGAGDYDVAVQLVAIDGRTQDGTAVTVTVA